MRVHTARSAKIYRFARLQRGKIFVERAALFFWQLREGLRAPRCNKLHFGNPDTEYYTFIYIYVYI